MIAGESKKIMLTFATGIVADLTISGIALSGTIYVDQQPYFRFSLAGGSSVEITATVHPTNKNVAIVELTPDLSAKLPNYNGNIYVGYELTTSANQKYVNRIKVENLYSKTPPRNG